METEADSDSYTHVKRSKKIVVGNKCTVKFGKLKTLFLMVGPLDKNLMDIDQPEIDQIQILNNEGDQIDKFKDKSKGGFNNRQKLIDLNAILPAA